MSVWEIFLIALELMKIVSFFNNINRDLKIDFGYWGTFTFYYPVNFPKGFLLYFCYGN